MKRTYTKKELHTGDIIETRNGGRGVVILEKGCILYQAGGLDVLDEVFTDDLFVDGPAREGDIFKVYHDPEGPLGFQKLFGVEPVFERKNDKYTKQRSAELSAKYEKKQELVTAVVLNPHYRHFQKIEINILDKRALDYDLSEAPSMMANGQIGIDRTFVAIPDDENLFLLYNAAQEEWLRQQHENRKRHWPEEAPEPVIAIPELNVEIYSRCLIVRKNDSCQLESLQEGDFEKVKKYLVNLDAYEK